MAEKRVVQYECDNCHRSGESEDLAHSRGINRLPKDWAEMRLRTNTNQLKDQTSHLCDRCMKAVTFALLEVKVFDK